MFAITDVRIFDGVRVVDARNLVVDGRLIRSVGGQIPAGCEIVDGEGGTLLPGLIDSHVHTFMAGLEDALRFGVTTELEMGGLWTKEDRAVVAERDDVADLRTAGLALTAPGGHPYQLFKTMDAPAVGPSGKFLTATSPEEAADFVEERISEGSDYIKLMIEDGVVLAEPGLPVLPTEVMAAVVREAHSRGKIALAHALTLDSTRQALEVGVDGLAHAFFDQPHTAEIVESISQAGVFVVPCLTLNRSIMGKGDPGLAEDPRVAPKLSFPWRNVLCSCFNTFPKGKMEDVIGTVRALHQAGVEILAGTDVSFPVPALGGLAHGASLHRELQLLVEAGLTPVEALRAATSGPARRFHLGDRGRLERGLRADLLLVDGDPTSSIKDTLAVRAVWRRGTRLKTQDVAPASG